jgi:hypothetical protein
MEKQPEVSDNRLEDEIDWHDSERVTGKKRRIANIGK